MIWFIKKSFIHWFSSDWKKPKAAKYFLFHIPMSFFVTKCNINEHLLYMNALDILSILKKPIHQLLIWNYCIRKTNISRHIPRECKLFWTDRFPSFTLILKYFFWIGRNDFQKCIFNLLFCLLCLMSEYFGKRQYVRHVFKYFLSYSLFLEVA